MRALSVRHVVESLVGIVDEEPRALVVYSAMWPLARALALPPDAIAVELV